MHIINRVLGFHTNNQITKPVTLTHNFSIHPEILVNSKLFFLRRYVQIQKNTFMKDIPTLLSQCFGDIAYPGSFVFKIFSFCWYMELPQFFLSTFGVVWLRPTDLVDQPTKPSSTNPIDSDIANRFHNAVDGEGYATV